MSYSYSQLMQLWIQAGGAPAKAPLMAAIALAESGGNAGAINRNTNNSTDRGLWQVNSIWGSRSTSDPMANAKAAVYIEQKQGRTAWATYNSGKYRPFLVTDSKVTRGPGVAQQGLDFLTDPLNLTKDKQMGVIDAVTSVPEFLEKLRDPNTWLRVGEGILGTFCIIGSVILLVPVIADKSGATKMAGQVVGIVGPGGKVAKAASVVSNVTGKKEK